MKELGYSLHLSNDKNKTKRARQFAKKSDNNSTSFSNNAIQNHYECIDLKCHQVLLLVR